MLSFFFAQFACPPQEGWDFEMLIFDRAGGWLLPALRVELSLCRAIGGLESLPPCIFVMGCAWLRGWRRGLYGLRLGGFLVLATAKTCIDDALEDRHPLGIDRVGLRDDGAAVCCKLRLSGLW